MQGVPLEWGDESLLRGDGEKCGVTDIQMVGENLSTVLDDRVESESSLLSLLLLSSY